MCCFFRSGWLYFFRKKRQCDIDCNGARRCHQFSTTRQRPRSPPEDRAPANEIHKCSIPKWQTVTRPRHRAPEQQSRRQASLHRSITQVKGRSRELTQTRVARGCKVMHKRSYKYSVWRYPLRHTPLAREPPRCSRLINTKNIYNDWRSFVRKLHSLPCIREISREKCTVGQFWLLPAMCHTPLISYELISKYRLQIN